MNFNAKIESVDPSAKQMVVEYFDPHGGSSRRLAMSFNYDSTPEDLNQIIINNTPHNFFHNRNEELKAIQDNNIDHGLLTALVGETIEYNLSTDNNQTV
jgi:hypothetical protein